MSKIYAGYAHYPTWFDRDSSLEHVLAGDVMFGDSIDWGYWWQEEDLENKESAHRFYKRNVMNGGPQKAVALVSVEVPEDVLERARLDGDRQGLVSLMGFIEYTQAWIDSAVRVIRQNENSRLYRETNAARLERIAMLTVGVVNNGNTNARI